jgi:hypothetical protein
MEEKFAEMDLDDRSVTNIGDEKGLSWKKTSYSVIAMFNEQVYNQHIANFECLNSAYYIIFSNDKEKESIEKHISNIDYIEIKVFINWMPLWVFQLNSDNLLERSQSRYGRYMIVFRRQNVAEPSKSLVARYEELFAETERQSRDAVSSEPQK